MHRTGTKRSLDSSFEAAHTDRVNCQNHSDFVEAAPSARRVHAGRLVALTCAGVTLGACQRAASGVDPALDWPGWRGPTGDGLATPGQNPPVQWSETGNIVWKTPIAGRGH